MEIKVNLDNLTIGDLEMFELWATGSAKMRDLIPLLDRIVESEVPVRQMPAKNLKSILEAIGEQLKGMSEAKN